MSRKARQYQDLGECRRCRQWAKVNSGGLCIYCRHLSTGGVAVRTGVTGETAEKTEPREPVGEVVFS